MGKKGKPTQEALPVQSGPAPSVPAVPEQAPLFDEVMLPRQRQLEERAKEFIRTGKILCKDDERCEAIVEAILSRWSRRRIARTYHIARESIDAIVMELERVGKLRPLQERLKRKWGTVVEDSLDNLEEDLADGKVPANVLVMAAGVGTDKVQLLMGSATAIIEHKKEPSTEEIVATFARLRPGGGKVIDVGPAETQSSGLPSNPQQMPALPEPDTTLDTIQAPPQADLAPTAEGGRGGSAPGAGGGQSEESDQRKFLP